MKHSFLLFILLSSIVLGCAKKDPEVLSSEDIRVYTYSIKVNANTASCFVQLFRTDQPSVEYVLEEDSIIACDGHYTVPTGTGGYGAIFSHPGYDPIKVTIVRPKAGATVIAYSNLP